ncbi:putative proline racemase [Sphingomonas changbaiensis NBRC 104936]|uniref:Putative proline racemase n=1 Tax=Sphingomonas changbaiensis NBRC 104936 TaxID=1219043 RepID=A0A0E9MMC6_9SPHN|nr:proline racemase family protein [Sphingomonas changbaiensis]GAO38663.1 putative proline racemase [Sphingomonas changbaiensis NBRC 104936]
MAGRIISVVGCHAEGEVGDVIIGGVLPPAGETMFAKMQAMERDHDHIRRLLLCEPRGSVNRHVNLLVPPTRADCDAGAIIMEPTEYVPMSGSNTICIVTVLLETGILPMTEPETIVTLDLPGGVVRAKATCEGGKCVSVEFENVPCFVDRLDASIEVDGVGPVKLDVAYGGMFFAIVDAGQFGLAVDPENARRLAELGEKIRIAAREQLDVVHPENPAIRGVSIVQFTEPFQGAGKATRNTCIVSPGRSDRSPTGTGTSARLAVLHARGQIQVGEPMAHSSIIGSRFEGRIVRTTEICGRPAIVPTIRGRAWITGFHHYRVDPTDPWPTGYVVSDTWGVTGKLSQ